MPRGPVSNWLVMLRRSPALSLAEKGNAYPFFTGQLRPLAGFDLAGGDDGLGAALDAELLQDGGHVRLDGRLRHAELVGDLLVE